MSRRRLLADRFFCTTRSPTAHGLAGSPARDASGFAVTSAMDSGTATASQDPIRISLFIASSGMVEPPQSVIARGACTRHRRDGFDYRLGMMGDRDVFDEWVDGAQAPIAIGIPADRIGLDEKYSRGRGFGKGEQVDQGCSFRCRRASAVPTESPWAPRRFFRGWENGADLTTDCTDSTDGRFR